MTETQIKRTRETNPIYQGEYTIEDYQKDRVKGFTTAAALEFVNRIKLPQEEKDRLKQIDEQAKERYKGATEWDVGGLHNIEGYDYRDIDPLDYYQTFYELEGGAAILKRLDQLNEMAAYMELRNTIYLELKARAKKRPDLKKALKEWATVWNLASLQPINQTQELKARLSDMAIFFGCENPPDYDALIDDEIAFLRKDAETMKGIIDLGDLEALRKTEYAPIVEITEAGLTEDVFNQSFEPFRKTHKGKGLEDARLRVARSTIYLIQKVGTEDIENVARENLGGEILTQEALSRCSENEPAASVLPIAKENPVLGRTVHIMAHGPITNEIGHRRPNLTKVQTLIDEKNKPWTKITTPINKNTEIVGFIGPPAGVELNCRHSSIMSAITAALIEKDPKAFNNGSWNVKLDIPETELIGRYRGIDKKKVTEEYKEEFLADMLVLRATMCYVDWSEYMATNKPFRKALEEAFPNCTGRILISLIDFKRYEVCDTMGNLSWRYKIERFPTLDFFDINLNLASKLRYTIKEAPPIRWDAVPPIIKEYMEALSTHKNPSIQLFKEDKDGNRYIPALKTPEKSMFMDFILRAIETQKRLKKSTAVGYFDMNLSEIYEEVWGDPTGTNQKIIRDRKTALLSYLYRLWIKEIETPGEIEIYGVTVLTKGKNWQRARVYLSEIEEKIPFMAKDPDPSKGKTIL